MRSNKAIAKTKIICTLGPASQSVDQLVDLIDAGMDVARLNFSHGTHEDHLASMQHVHEARIRTGEHIAILQDLCGPKIRTGKLRNNSILLKEGAAFQFTIDEIAGDEHRVSTTYRELPEDVQAGDTILLDDGKMSLRVVSKTERDVECTVVNGGILKEHKGMNLPGVTLSTPSLTEKDIDDLKFGLDHDVDYVALSFVRSAQDIRHLRTVICQHTKLRVPIVAKIEMKEAIDAIDSIIAETDAVMVARGDLGVEMMPEDVPILQKMIVRKCNEAGVPVIIATQMLESMIENPRPTRAEASDVANAVLDGADAVMLSAETSVGKHPVETVITMDRIICRAEIRKHDHLSIKQVPAEIQENVFDAIARSACVLARQVNAAAIVPITHSGATAVKISKYRPESKIVAVTSDERILRSLNLIWSVRGIEMKDFIHDNDTAFRRIIEKLKVEGYVERGSIIVFTAGLPLMAMGTTDTVHVERVE
ncbi:MAG: pyruvate kinase [Ignavibacteriae bacterium]|nr:MAG: pyruvate kinase [Ignavibacteriota bacterium]